MLKSLLVITVALGLLMAIAGAVYGNPLPAAPCCLPDGTCELMDEESCLLFGGIFMIDLIECEPNPCAAIGGCWFCYGECLQISEEECIALGPAGAIHWIEGQPCDPNPFPPEYCLTACCLPDGSCITTTVPGACEELSGEFLGGFVSCDSDPCVVSGVGDDPHNPILETTWGWIKDRYR